MNFDGLILLTNDLVIANSAKFILTLKLCISD